VTLHGHAPEKGDCRAYSRLFLGHVRVASLACMAVLWLGRWTCNQEVAVLSCNNSCQVMHIIRNAFVAKQYADCHSVDHTARAALRSARNYVFFAFAIWSSD